MTDPKEKLKAEWQAEVDAGTTKLTYNEWAARRIMSEAAKAPMKTGDKSKPVDKKPRAIKAEKPIDLDNVIKDPSAWQTFKTKDIDAAYDKEVAAGNTNLEPSVFALLYMTTHHKSKNPQKKASEIRKIMKVAAAQTKTIDGKPHLYQGKTYEIVDKLPGAAEQAPVPTPVDKPKGLQVGKVDDKTVLASGLTARQEMFCREYIACDYNATQAAKNAGYSEKTARSIGSENLTKPDIQRFIAELQKPRLEELDISHDRIMREYAAMAFANQADFLAQDKDGKIITNSEGLPYFDFTGVTREQMAGLGGLKITILPSMGEDDPNPIKIETKLSDKKAALDVLAKRAGLLKEVVEHTGTVKVVSDQRDLAMRIAFMLRKAAQDDKKDTGLKS